MGERGELPAEMLIRWAGDRPNFFKRRTLRFGIDVVIPEKPPIVSLHPGDSVIVMAVRGLPRLEGRHEYTPEEVAGA